MFTTTAMRPGMAGMMMPAQSSNPTKHNKLPPFLKKLVDLTNSCPPHIGGWNEDGTQFVVRSSQFADLLREQFQGSLQTFVRQLHFYSFNKKDDGARGIWTFSHPHFIRGQPHLLVNIERKSNPKKKNGARDEDDDEVMPSRSHQHELSSAVASSSSSLTSGVDKAAINALEKRVGQMEKKLERMTALEREMETLKQELVALKDFAAAQNLLSLAPSSDTTKKRVKEDPLKSVDDNIKSSDKDESLLNLPPPKKVTRLISTDSVLGELKDFPFEDTSSVGSVSVREMLRELQNDIFNNEFDDFIPASASSKFTSMEANMVASPAQQTAEEPMMCGGKEKEGECFNIPSGFELQPGVTMPLLKQVYCLLRQMVCPNVQREAGEANTFEKLRKMVDDLTPPANLLPVEMCPITRELLPALRERVTEDASDLALMRAARQVYEIYYQTIQKKMHEMGQRSSSNIKDCASQSSSQ